MVIMKHQEDSQIRGALLEGTDEAAKLKDMVWENIQKEISLSGRKKRNMKTKKKRVSAILKYGSIAAAMALVITANTQYGHAAVDRVRALFAPEKNVTQSIEGIGEDTQLTLKEGSMNYIIYIDEANYSIKTIDGKDRIIPTAKMENYPEVFMQIDQVEGKAPEVLSSELKSELQGKYATVEDRGAVEVPVKSTVLYARSGLKWNDTVTKYYLLDDTKGGTFVVQQKYFVEAEEGHGARFDNMLKEFKVVED
jgi:hypothetical protein